MILFVIIYERTFLFQLTLLFLKAKTHNYPMFTSLLTRAIKLCPVNFLLPLAICLDREVEWNGLILKHHTSHNRNDEKITSPSE